MANAHVHYYHTIQMKAEANYSNYTLQYGVIHLKQNQFVFIIQTRGELLIKVIQTSRNY